MREAAWLMFAVPAAIVIGCVVVTEKPADSAPPAATTTGTAPTQAPPPPATAEPAAPSEPAAPPAKAGGGIRSTGKRSRATGPAPSETGSDAGVFDASPQGLPDALPTAIPTTIPTTVPGY
jgi:hypothetical protein